VNWKGDVCTHDEVVWLITVSRKWCSDEEAFDGVSPLACVDCPGLSAGVPSLLCILVTRLIASGSEKGENIE
jgi:hypothetical protein